MHGQKQAVQLYALDAVIRFQIVKNNTVRYTL